MLTILDGYTRECHVLRADPALNSADVLEWISKAIAEHGAPENLRSNNGSEFIAREVQRWLAKKSDQDNLHRAGQPMAKRVRCELPSIPSP